MSKVSKQPKGFQCKQFFVAHDQCAMKVSTDSLILGSFVDTTNTSTMLDVGTGSGILALMMAQKSAPDSAITAIDIDPGAIAQAGHNAANSSWPEKIRVEQSPLQEMGHQQQFDLIVSNPPYFADAVSPTRAYASMSEGRGLARTEQTLSIDDFFAQTAALSHAGSRLYCMYPTAREGEVFNSALQSGWHVKQSLSVRHNASSAPYLGVYCFVRVPVSVAVETLTIRTGENQYTPEYKQLCADFYLNF
ncbi:methyltransferase [Alteromonas sp. ZYF713]|nr:methyltransferase [Alteromonas sp. ZYF713]